MSAPRFLGLSAAASLAASEDRKSKAVLSAYRNCTEYLRDILDNGGADPHELALKVAGIAEELGTMLSRVRREVPPEGEPISAGYDVAVALGREPRQS